ncbi:Flp family type IVb pilin [Streptomyces sp. NPDC096152]|uniref:Flp family type IVb pilin n=1 Tax=Streptomyces sp. NPDC096152 TaxID=3366078 RepID=UPI00381CFAF8
MASVGGVPEFEGPWSSGRGGRRGMPRSLAVALTLVHVLFVATVLGGVGLLLTASSYDVLDGGVIALVAYAAAPGVLGWWLARRTWEGGARVRRGLIAVQVWLILGGLTNLAAGSVRGGVQLFLPVLIVYFLLQSESREWYGLPELERAERRPFSLARMIRWRRGGDEGQTAIEYAGLVSIVVAIVTALVVSGLGTQIYGGIQAQVCKVVGMGCPAPANGTATDASGTTPDGRSTDGRNPDGRNTGPTGGDTTTDSGTNSDGNESGNENGNGDQNDGGNQGDGGDQGDNEKKDDGCFSGVGAFFGCAGDQVKQVGQGLFVDGVWGDVTGIYGMVRHPLDTLKGIGDYGKQLGEDWWDNSQGARDEWSKGDYFGAVWDWGGASLKTGGTVLYDMFIGDDVANDWKNGDKTRAVTHVIWNVGSLFIPGYDAAKVVEKVGELGKLAKLGKLAEKAGKAAEDAKKAARAGDVEGAEKAAKQADEAADEAEKKARQSGCTLSAPARGTPYGDGPRDATPGTLTGAPGTGTTVLAAGASSPFVILAEDGCDEEAKKEAQEARKQADEADKTSDDIQAKKKEWVAGPDVEGPAAGKTLKFPHPRHTVAGAKHGQVRPKNSVILKGHEGDVAADIKAIAENKAVWNKQTNRYEINGRTYGIEDSGRMYPDSGPGIVMMDRNEYAALTEIAKANGDVNAPALTKNPRFANNPEAVAKAKKVYDGTYK